jgi:hypothetical protein
MKIFDFLNALTNGTQIDFDNDEIQSSYDVYQMNRWISMCEIYVPFVNQVNKYKIDKDVHFEYFNSIIPKRKQFFSYIKKEKEYNLDALKYIAQYYEIGLKEAEIYYSMLNQEDIDKIINIYKNKKIKSLKR